MPSAAPCAFCGESRPLVESHLIPRFVQNRLRRSIGGALFRKITSVNQRVQQMYHGPWLCRDCDQMFGVDEDFFARMIDAPWDQESLSSVRITPQVERFLAAMAWKIMTWDFGDDDVRTVDEEFHIGWARPLLYDFLRGKSASVPVVDHHLYFPALYEGPRRGVNTLYRASILPTLCGNKSCVFTLAVLGGYLAITILNPNVYNRKEWNGGTLAFPGATLSLSGQHVDSPVFDNMVDEINRQGLKANKELSERQREKTIQSHRRHESEIGTSKPWIAMQKDRDNRKRFGPDDGDI